MCCFAAHNFLPREGYNIQFVPSQILCKRSRGRVTDGQTSAVCRDEIAVRYAYARSGAVPCEHNVVVKVHFGEINDFAVFSGVNVGFDFQLFHNVGDPASAEGFPSDHFSRAFAQQRPHSHFNRAGVGRRNDADVVVSRDAQNFTGVFDGCFQLFFADSCAVRAAQRRISKLVQRKGGDFGAWARRKTRIGRTRCRSFDSHRCYPLRYMPYVGVGCPTAGHKPQMLRLQ